jgi:hypothetical protein
MANDVKASLAVVRETGCLAQSKVSGLCGIGHRLSPLLYESFVDQDDLTQIKQAATLGIQTCLVKWIVRITLI